LVEAQRIDVTVELAQWVEPFCSTTAGVTHKIIKPILACDYCKVCDAIGQPNPHLLTQFKRAIPQAETEFFEID